MDRVSFEILEVMLHVLWFSKSRHYYRACGCSTCLTDSKSSKDCLAILFLNSLSICYFEVAVIPSWCCMIANNSSALSNFKWWSSYTFASLMAAFTKTFLTKLINRENLLQTIFNSGSVVKYPDQYRSWSQFDIKSNCLVSTLFLLQYGLTI